MAGFFSLPEFLSLHASHISFTPLLKCHLNPEPSWSPQLCIPPTLVLIFLIAFPTTLCIISSSVYLFVLWLLQTELGSIITEMSVFSFKQRYFLVWFLKIIYLAVPDFSCSMWDLVLCLGIEPWPPALGAQSLSHWTTREVPRYLSFVYYYIITVPST